MTVLRWLTSDVTIRRLLVVFVLVTVVSVAGTTAVFVQRDRDVKRLDAIEQQLPITVLRCP